MAATAPLLAGNAGKLDDKKGNVAKFEADDHASFEEGWRVKRKAWLTNVPAWFESWGLKVNDEDMEIADIAITKQSAKWIKSKLNKEGADMEDHTVGPALKIAFRVNAILWIFFLLFPWACGFLMSCPPVQTDKSKGLALVGYPLWLWVPFLLLVYGLLRMEAVACKSSIVTQVMTAGIPFSGRFAYKGFLYLMLAISLFYHFDIFTNGVYMARVWKTEQCMRGNEDYKKVTTMTIETIWHQTMLHSAAAKTFLSYIPYWGWAVVAWMSLLLQPAYAYGYAWPLSPELQPPKNKNDEEDATIMHPEEKPVEYVTRASGTDCAQYQVVFRGDQQHGRALQAISESARMNSIYFLDPAYMHHQVKTWQPGEVHREMQRCNVRFFIFVVETIFPPNLQASFLCMEKALAGNSDYVIFVSVLVSFLTGFIYVRGELTTVFNFHSLVLKQKDKFDVWEEQNGASRELQFKAKAAVRHANRSKVICIGLAMLGIFMLTQAVLKAYMGAFVCECGMWNNKGWPLSKGCVPFETFVELGVKTACGRTAP